MQQNNSFLDSILCDNGSFIIYGAGVFGKRVFQALRDKHKNVICFFVSSKNASTPDRIEDVPVYSLDEQFEASLENTIVLVAMREELHSEIKESIKNSWLSDSDAKIHFLSETQVCELFRNCNPIDCSNIFNKITPISNSWGFDRGTPIDRYFIEGFLQRESEKYQNAELTYEVGEDVYSKRFFPNSKHEVLDLSMGMDLTVESSIPANRYDVFICTQTFHQIYDVKKAIQGSWNLLKNGGVMLATVCGTIVKQARTDEYEHFWGFTESSITRLMQEAYGDNVTVTPYGNAMVATAFIQGLAAEELDPELLNKLDDDYTICLSIVAKKVCDS